MAPSRRRGRSSPRPAAARAAGAGPKAALTVPTLRFPLPAHRHHDAGAVGRRAGGRATRPDGGGDPGAAAAPAPERATAPSGASSASSPPGRSPTSPNHHLRSDVRIAAR